MNLLDIIMREICAEMDWADRKEPGFYTGRIRARLTPVAEAAQAVIDAAKGASVLYPGHQLRAALAALEEATHDT